MKYVFWLIFALSLAAPLQADDSWHSPHSARYLVGERATICGMVGSTRYATNARGSPTYINLGPAYPNHVFTIVIWGENRYKFEYAPEALEGTICVRGLIGMYRDIPQIVASSPEQIQR